MGNFGLTIDGKHTSDLGLKMTSMYIPQPKPKTNPLHAGVLVNYQPDFVVDS